MNKIHSFIIPFILTSLFWSFSAVYSQGLPPPGEIIDFLNLKTLTEEQKQILIDERQKIKQSRINFRNSLTKEQKAILSNSKLSKEQRRSRLVASFSKNQKNLIRESEKRIKSMASKIRPTLTDKQKKEIRGIKTKNNRFKTGDSRGTRFNKDKIKDRKKPPFKPKKPFDPKRKID